jgi:hypothetical protein
MARELITKNKIINENWMYTVGANADSRMFYPTAAYWYEAPIGGCLYKKLLEPFSFANTYAKID